MTDLDQVDDRIEPADDPDGFQDLEQLRVVIRLDVAEPGRAGDEQRLRHLPREDADPRLQRVEGFLHDRAWERHRPPRVRRAAIARVVAPILFHLQEPRECEILSLLTTTPD